MTYTSGYGIDKDVTPFQVSYSPTIYGAISSTCMEGPCGGCIGMSYLWEEH